MAPAPRSSVEWYSSTAGIPTQWVAMYYLRLRRLDRGLSNSETAAIRLGAGGKANRRIDEAAGVSRKLFLAGGLRAKFLYFQNL